MSHQLEVKNVRGKTGIRGRVTLSKRFRTGALGLSLVLPSFLILVALVIIPIIGAVITSLQTDAGTFTFKYYRLMFSDPVMRSDILFTIKVTLFSTVGTLIFSYPLAVYLRFGKGQVVQWIKRLYFIPMFIPSVIATYSLISLYGQHGWMDTILHHLGNSHYPKIIYDIRGLILSQLWFHIPFTTMLLASSLEGVPDSQIESARDIGANYVQILLKIIIPLTSKTTLVAVTFIFMGVIGGYTAPYMLGPNAPQMLGVLIQQTFGVYLEPAQSSALAVLMFLMCTLVGFIYIRSMVKENQEH